MNSSRGYSIVEVVACGAVVLTLIVVIVPVSAGVSSKSKHQHCLTNLSRLGAANLTYAAEDPNNMAIPVHALMFYQDFNSPSYIGAYDWGGKSGIGSQGYVDAPDELSSRYGTAAGFGPATRPLNRYLYGELADHTEDAGEDNANWWADTQLELNLHRCPSDTGPPPGAHCPDWLANRQRTSFDHFGTSYSANLFMTASGSGGNMYSNSPYLHKLRDIPKPDETLLYQENNGRWAWAVRETPSCFWIGQGVFPEGTIRGWHGRNWMFTAAFVDGHVDTIYMNSFRVERAFVDESQQEQHRCIIIRGENWRKDTSPLSRVPTGLNHNGNGRPSYDGCVETQ